MGGYWHPVAEPCYDREITEYDDEKKKRIHARARERERERERVMKIWVGHSLGRVASTEEER